MKKYKLNMTRPEFLYNFFREVDFANPFSEKTISKVIPSKAILIYIAYCVILESNLDYKSINMYNCDDETVVIKLIDKKFAKTVCENADTRDIHCNNSDYKVSVKRDGSYLYITPEKIE